MQGCTHTANKNGKRSEEERIKCRSETLVVELVISR